METSILKLSERGEAWLSVYRAGAKPDSQDDTISIDELFYAVSGFANSPEIKLQHGQEEVKPDSVHVISSFMTGPKGYQAKGFSVKPHTWVLGLKFDLQNKEGQKLWARIKAGKAGKTHADFEGEQLPSITGLSLGGKAIRELVSE